jgi:hypothetical protein
VGYICQRRFFPTPVGWYDFGTITYERGRGRAEKGKTEQTFMAMLKKVAIVVVAWVVCVLVYLEFFTKGR